MSSEPIEELEGTWEEIAAHAAELAGKRVRLTVLSGGKGAAEPGAAPDRPAPSPVEASPPLYREASGRPVLDNAGTWEGESALLTDGEETESEGNSSTGETSVPETPQEEHGFSTAGSLLKFAGKWEGDDIEECMEMVRNTRSKIQF